MTDTVVVLADAASVTETTVVVYRVRLSGNGWKRSVAATLAEERVREHFRAGGRGSLVVRPRGELIVHKIFTTERKDG